MGATPLRRRRARIIGAVVVCLLTAGVGISSGAHRSAAAALHFANGVSITNAIAAEAAILSKSGSINYSTNTSLTRQIANIHGDTPPRNCEAGYDVTSPKFSMCQFGSTASKHVVVLFGDSHAWQWIPPLSAIAMQRHWKLIVFSKASCPVENVTFKFPATSTGPMAGKVYSACTNWRANVIGEIRKLHPALVVMSSIVLWPQVVPTSKFETGLSQTIAMIGPLVSGGRSHIVFVNDVPNGSVGPQLRFTSAECLTRAGLRLRFSSVDTARNLYAPDPAVCYRPWLIQDNPASVRDGLLATASKSGAVTIDPRPWICLTTSPDDLCPPVIDGTLVYFDFNHLSATYSARLTTVFGSLLPHA